MHKKSDSGFTLVELAISMIIVGLLIGGILKGSTLVENARLKRFASSIKSIEAASYTFYDMYKAYPGDVKAEIRVPGCTSENFCVSGDQNGYVGSDGSEQYMNDSMILNMNGDSGETFQYWKHLALQDLIGGISVGANPANPAFGVTHPASSIANGGFEVYWDANVQRYIGGSNTTGAHILRPSPQTVFSRRTFERMWTGINAAKIDVLMDDGFPNTGTVVGNYGAVTDNCKINRGGRVVYNETRNSGVCSVYYLMFK